MDHVRQIASDFKSYADRDYLAARTLFRNKCLDHFLYMVHQTTEKYLKTILLYTKIPINKTHSLSQLLKKVDEHVLYFSLCAESRMLIAHIDNYNSVRYPDFPFYGNRIWLLHFDRLVKELRFFSQSPDSGIISRYIASSKRVESFERYVLDPKVRLSISGYIEKVLKNEKAKYTVERKNLVWCNLYYAGKKRKVMKFQEGFWSKNNYLFGGGGAKWQKEVYEETRNYLKYSKVIETYLKSICDKD